MSKISKTALFFLFTLLILVSCRKKETLEVDNETQSVVDNVLAEQEFEAIVPACQQHAINTRGTGAEGTRAVLSCDSLTKISGDTSWAQAGHSNPVYQFNTSTLNCASTMPDNKPRTGLISIKLTDRVKTPGAKMIIRLNNYKASNFDYTVDSIVVTTISSNNLSTVYNVKVINGAVKQGTITIKFSSDKTVTNYYNGNPAGTEPYSSTFGTVNGINRQGKAFTGNIPAATPLIKSKKCEFITRGMMELIPQGFKARNVDYGNGICDDAATFSVNGNSISFKLK